jgi:acyl carrier protein
VREAELEARLRGVLAAVAPGSPVDALAADAPLRTALQLDEVDFLEFVIALHEAFGVDVPEDDYRQLETLDGCVRYLGLTRSGRR